MLRSTRRPLVAMAAMLMSVVGLMAPASGAAKAPAADCQPFAHTPCLLPFPNNLFTRPDHRTPTGLRVKLPAGAMPVNTAGKRIGVGEYDRADGFSPGSALIVHVAGLDLGKTGAVGLPTMKGLHALPRATNMQKSTWLRAATRISGVIG